MNSHHGELLAYLQTLNHKFDGVCLSEIWNYNFDFLRNLSPDYTPYFDKVTDSNIGGVAIFVKNTYLFSERKDLKITNSKGAKQKTSGLK